MNGLTELKIPPLTGRVSLGKGRLSSEMRIPKIDQGGLRLFRISNPNNIRRTGGRSFERGESLGNQIVD